MVGIVEQQSESISVSQPATQARTGEAESCFHCGLPCPDEIVDDEARHFCCTGCRTVHELLTASGLGHFYDLDRHPGIRVPLAKDRANWSYLDEPKVAQQLLDFRDERMSRIRFQLPTIHCIACVWLLENLFQLHPAIGQCSVNFPKREASITFATGKIALSELAALLASIGYEPLLTLDKLDRKQPATSRKRQWLQLGLAGFAFGNIMLFSLPTYLGLDSFSGAVFKTLFGYLGLALSLPVVVFSASGYWRSAFLSLRQRMLTLDVPIALGLAAIFVQSAFEIFTGRGGGYCDSLTGLIFFLLCGRVFQQKTHDRIAFDRDYKSFFPLSVTRKTQRGQQTASLSSLEVGDVLLLRYGELLPADARLLAGHAELDYSFVTGEAEPVEKEPGDYLYAGARQLGGIIEVEIVKPVSQSYLTSLWNHEAFRKDHRNNLDTLTNRYSRRFTLLVLAVALGAAIFWFSRGDAARGIKSFTSVLIVACPCALALAAPFTLGTAQRLLASNGVFLRNGLVLEKLACVDTIVFDKTGTLTEAGGALSFSGNLNRFEERLVFSLASHSTHPHARKIASELGARHTARPVALCREIPGCGMSGIVGTHVVMLGSAAWFRFEKLVAPEPAEREMGSVVCVAIDGTFRGRYTLGGSYRPEARALVGKLGAARDIVLLTGDNDRERENLQTLFGRNARLLFNQSPLDKLNFIQSLQKSGRSVLMAGDGLNDSGALKQSDVGVAVVDNIGAFSPASDVIIEGRNLACLTNLLSMARRSTTIVRVSFLISALYNLVGISIASAALLSPLVCAILMPLSSASVVAFACGATILRGSDLWSDSSGLLRNPEPKSSTT